MADNQEARLKPAHEGRNNLDQGAALDQRHLIETLPRKLRALFKRRRLFRHHAEIDGRKFDNGRGRIHPAHQQADVRRAQEEKRGAP